MTEIVPTETANDRKQALLDAAAAILEEDGVDALSARNVADRAGVNKGLVFYYWGSTQGLFEQVLERYYAEHKSSLEAAFDAGGSLAERVHQVLDEYLDFMEQHGAYARIVQSQVSSGGPLLPLVQRHLSEVLELTTRMLGDVTPASGPLSARHFHLSLSAIVINYFTYGPVLGKAWLGKEPLGRAALKERRAHIHWVADAWLEKLQRDQ